MRMNIIATNLANAHTTRTPEGGPYKPQQVVFGAQSRLGPFEQLLLSEQRGTGGREVQVVGITEDPEGVRMMYDPKHPDANEAGYVGYPDINIMQEMADLLATTRSYEANMTVITAAKEMASRALQIGRL